MGNQFKVDNLLKQEYLSTKPTLTAEKEVFVLRHYDRYEELVEKPAYNLSFAELREMFSCLHNSSIGSTEKNKSILVSYINFCINKNVVVHRENRARYINVNDFVSNQAVKNKYISKSQLREYSNMLFNEQDRLLLWLPFISVLGRTQKGCSKEEIINLTINDIFPDENILILRQNNGEFRKLYLQDADHFIFDLIKEAYEQEFYVENNGEQTFNELLGGEPRNTLINQTGQFSRYIFRIPGKNKYEPFTPSLMNSRMRRIQKIIGNRYITWTSLYLSGMIQMAMDIYNKNGEVTNNDFNNICAKFNYGAKDEVSSNQQLSSNWFKLKKIFNKCRELT